MILYKDKSITPPDSQLSYHKKQITVLFWRQKLNLETTETICCYCLYLNKLRDLILNQLYITYVCVETSSSVTQG